MTGVQTCALPILGSGLDSEVSQSLADGMQTVSASLAKMRAESLLKLLKETFVYLGLPKKEHIATHTGVHVGEYYDLA